MGQGLWLLREEDLLEMGVLRGHARRIMARLPLLLETAGGPAGPA